MFAYSENGTCFAVDALIYRATPIAQWNDWKGKRRVSIEPENLANLYNISPVDIQ
jgi:hypothetical protein